MILIYYLKLYIFSTNILSFINFSIKFIKPFVIQKIFKKNKIFQILP